MAIAFHEIEGRKLLLRLPSEIVKNEVAEVAVVPGDTKEDQLDRILARIGKLVTSYLPHIAGMDGEFLFEFAYHRLAGRFTRFHLAARKLPFERVGLLWGALPDENQPFALENCGNYLNHVVILEHMMYPERLIEHFQNPRNVGELAPPALVVEVSNPACGDILRLSVRWAENRVADVRYKVRGCTASIAAGSALTEWLAGKSRDEVAEFTAVVVDQAVGGLPAASKHAAVLCADGVKALLKAGS